MTAAVAAAAVWATTALASPAPSPGIATVTLVAHHSRWSQSTISVRPGQTVRFVVRNDDPIDHELIIGDDAVQAAHERGTDAHHQGTPGQVSVPAGATATTTYRFSSPGRLTFACHLPGHFAYGMHGTVLVKG